jgi:ribosomal protein L24E
MRTPAMGRWSEIERTWHDTEVTHCALCGRLVPRRVWIVEIDGQTLPFCNEECEGLYRSYWIPKYGNRESARDVRSPAPRARGESVG